MTTKHEGALSHLSWLDTQTSFPKIYWNSHTPTAATGSANGGRRQFSLFDFETLKQTAWHPEQFYLEPAQEKPLLSLPKPTLRVDTPNYTAYKELFAKNPLPKLVLGRKTTLHFQNPLDPIAIASHLFPKTPGTTHFLVQFSPTKALIGATPELLYHRHRSQIELDAIAGTAPKDESEHLLDSEKELSEWRHVHEHINNILAKSCYEHAAHDTPSLHTSANLHHLKTRFCGTLKPHITDDWLIENLHPTPAVCGTPQSDAKAFLQKLEPFKRGHYAAPIGWFEKNRTELHVAIRIAEIEERTLTLYAASGIVEGSTPEKEWEELDLKIAPWIEMFYAG